jgi:signal transduction histidine kinase
VPHPTTAGTHPLELIAPFRRWRPSPLRNLLYTALWNSLIGLALALAWTFLFAGRAPFAALLGPMMLTTNLIGFAIHGTLVALRRLVPGRRSRAMRACELLLMACCFVFGTAASEAVRGGANPFQAMLHAGTLARLLPFGVAVAVLMIAVLVAGERRIARETLAAQQQEKIAEAGRLLAEARLRALQAQIEPHFLYNTLANVVGLIGPAPDKARHMLERLIDFLRASLAASRADHATLGAELDLAGAYLDLLAVRLGTRLRYRIEAGAACRPLPIAPMLLQPLVENAVMHGIAPKVEGGEIVIRAGVADGALRIEVSDDGIGMNSGGMHSGGLGSAAPRAGGGVGLANLRDRLRSLHGPYAQVQLLENQTGGVTSRLLLPLSASNTVPPSTPSAP